MHETLETHPAESPSHTAAEAASGPVLAATDGHPQSDGALRIAHALAERAHAPLRVLSVLEPMPVVVAGTSAIVEAADREWRAGVADRVRGQVRRLLGGAEEVELLTGPVADVIGTHAATTGSRLIVVGIGSHRVADRLFGTETALRVVRLARTPVLAVLPDTPFPMRSAVVAMDFSATSTQAARRALELLQPPAVVHLVHVIAVDVVNVVATQWIDDYQRAVDRQLDRLVDALGVPEGIRIERSIRSGDAAAAVLRAARDTGADLIALGTHGHGAVTRLLLGSVTTKVLRHADCAVLTVPR